MGYLASFTVNSGGIGSGQDTIGSPATNVDVSYNINALNKVNKCILDITWNTAEIDLNGNDIVQIICMLTDENGNIIAEGEEDNWIPDNGGQEEVIINLFPWADPEDIHDVHVVIFELTPP